MNNMETILWFLFLASGIIFIIWGAIKAKPKKIKSYKTFLDIPISNEDAIEYAKDFLGHPTQADELEDQEDRRIKRRKMRYAIRQQLEQEVYAKTSFPDRHIPIEVKKKVWYRDKGKCQSCGNTENLEFDHIIPISKGGSNTEKNIQILCWRCNSLKRDDV